MEATHSRLPKRFTFPTILVPTMVVVVFANVTAAVALASRVSAAYFLLQAIIAGCLAGRRGSVKEVAGFVVIGLMMAAVMIFSIPV